MDFRGWLARIQSDLPSLLIALGLVRSAGLWVPSCPRGQCACSAPWSIGSTNTPAGS